MLYRLAGRLGGAISFRSQSGSTCPECQILLRRPEEHRNMLNLVSSRGQENPGGIVGPGSIIYYFW